MQIISTNYNFTYNQIDWIVIDSLIILGKEDKL